MHNCPLCGNEVTINKIEVYNGKDGFSEDWRIKCLTNGGIVRLDLPADNFYGRDFYNRNEAIEYWNKWCEQY